MAQGAFRSHVAAPFVVAGAALPSLRQDKEQDPTKGFRSVLLEEFRSNSRSNRRYELKVRLPCASRSCLSKLTLPLPRISITTL
jgi:hypothetical protein